jgi:ubiquinone/menaquinone biosynthesis C-methylase UbiE
LLRGTGIGVKTLDIDKSLGPDIVSSVMNIPLATSSVDAVVAFQVLEHLPYDEFASALREMSRVARSFVMLSLPDVSRWYRFDNWFPLIGHIRFQIRVPRLNPPVHEFDGEHYWEIGKKGYPLARIKETIETCGLSIEDTYRPWEYAYHRFFILQPDL